MTSGRRLLSNAFSLLTSDIVNRASVFALYLLVARYLGPEDFGRMALSFTFLYLFQVFASAGLRTFITREVAGRRDQTGHYLSGGLTVALGFAIASFAILFAVLALLGYERATTNVILLVCLALVPFSISCVCEGILQAHEKMAYIAAATVPMNVLKVAVVLGLLSRGAGLPAVALVVVSLYTATATGELVFVVRCLGARASTKGAGPIALATIKGTAPFLGIDVLIAAASTANVLLLSQLYDEATVGIYSAALQLVVPMGLLFRSVVLSAFPILCRKFEYDTGSARDLTERLMSALVVVALPVAVVLAYTADTVLQQIYGTSGFGAAADVLRIIVWQTVLIAMTSVLGQVLFAGRRENTTLRIFIFDAAAAFGGGVVLISAAGVIGAATTVLLVAIPDFVFHFVLARQLLPGLSLWRSVASPLLALALLTAPLLTEWAPVTVRIATGLVGYAIAVALLEIHRSGGVEGLRHDLVSAWSERTAQRTPA